MMLALKLWRHYLIGRRFELRIDHQSLKHLFTQRDLNARQRRWSEFMSEYDFEISYIKGKENVVADALSRRPRTFSLVALKVNLKEWILEKLFEDSRHKETLLLGSMKHDIVQFVAKCLECQRVKADHRHPTGLLQPHDIPTSKWEVISTDFVVGLPLTSWRHNAILVIVDKLTKSSHFIPVRDTYDVMDVARVFFNEVIRLHGLPTKIISHRDSRFTSRFWTSL
eukprot:PITA_34729